MEFISDRTLVLDALEKGENVFITGVGGCGKSYMVREFSSKTIKNHVVCGTTGIASLNVNGETIHRFMKLGINCRPNELKKVTAKWDAIKNSDKPWDKKRWMLMQNLQCLIIDEISMFRRDQFELLDNVMRVIYKKDIPFGGIQMVLVGDLLQLPPVVTEEELSFYKDLQRPHVFQSPVWEKANFRCMYLTTSYRQEDGAFLDALNEIRIGKVTKQTDELIKSRLNAKLDTEIDPIMLYSTNKNVYAENMRRLEELRSKKYTYTAVYTGNNYDVEALKKDSIAEDELVLCEDAQIMMLANDPKGRWVNGSMGKITNIKDGLITVRIDGGTYPVERNTWERIVPEVGKDGNIERVVKATMTQFPMKLAFSGTIHKSQSLTLQYVKMSLDNIFSPGQAYVALSRVKSLDGLTLTNWDKKSVFADPAVLEFYGVEANDDHNVIDKYERKDSDDSKVVQDSAVDKEPKSLFDF